LELKTEQLDNGIVILHLEGEMLGGPESEPIAEALRRAIEAGARGFLIDLRRVPWMSSGGVGTLTRSYTTIKSHHGKMKLLHASDRIRKILIVTGLIAVFEVFEDEATAIASFERP
jgi:anti-sigma B factor antagonist